MYGVNFEAQALLISDYASKYPRSYENEVLGRSPNEPAAEMLALPPDDMGSHSQVQAGYGGRTVTTGKPFTDCADKLPVLVDSGAETAYGSAGSTERDAPVITPPVEDEGIFTSGSSLESDLLGLCGNARSAQSGLEGMGHCSLGIHGLDVGAQHYPGNWLTTAGQPSDPLTLPTAGKRRTGRPLSYTGDPNSPHLTTEERRKIKRRTSNRESARRIRDKQQANLQNLSEKVRFLSAQRQELFNRAAMASRANAELETEVDTLRKLTHISEQERVGLQQEAKQLRHTLEEELSYLEDTFMKQEARLENPFRKQELGLESPFMKQEAELQSNVTNPANGSLWNGDGPQLLAGDPVQQNAIDGTEAMDATLWMSPPNFADDPHLDGLACSIPELSCMDFLA